MITLINFIIFAAKLKFYDIMLLLKIFLKRRGNFMKNIKISLIAVITATSFSSLGATPLEEAIKDVDVSGSLRSL